MFTANYTIEERNSINEGSEEDIDQLIGECYLLRAYMHFLLVNLYGQPYTRPGALETKAVPLKLNSDINEILKKIPLHRFTRRYSQISMKLKID